ncbi:MAG: sugar phosphate isomerase/epimerase [Bacteroidales bacterium]|nr:sugar phosphate isomerase/epimerase [Bacteroidales bacterium]
MTQWIVGNEDIESSFIRLKKCGYDGIEFAAEPYTLDQDRLKMFMRKYAICCTSLCGIFSESRDLTASVGDGGEVAVDYLKSSVDFAVKVGASLIIVVPSPVGRIEPVANRSYDTAWNNAITNIKNVADYAQGKGIMLAIEAINRYETYFVNTLTKALRLVQEINHPAVSIMADLFHMSIEENNLSASLRMIAKYLIHVHIADNTREAAGLGSTNFKEVLYTLRDIGYKGALTMEFMPRIANPYALTDMTTHSKVMDDYAEQSINYMKQMEKSIL